MFHRHPAFDYWCGSCAIFSADLANGLPHTCTSQAAVTTSVPAPRCAAPGRGNRACPRSVAGPLKAPKWAHLEYVRRLKPCQVARRDVATRAGPVVPRNAPPPRPAVFARGASLSVFLINCYAATLARGTNQVLSFRRIRGCPQEDSPSVASMQRIIWGGFERAS